MPLCLLHDYVTASLVDGHSTAGICLDLARAFDTVNVEILLAKLSKYGITGNALSLFSSYLSGRTHCLKYKESISGNTEITCGVPQRSILGPILFLPYINDLPNVCAEAKFLLFADDTAILYSAPTVNKLQLLISRSFPEITLWLHANRLSLSTHKTFYQLYSPGGAGTPDLSIPVRGIHLKRSPTVRYLGVLVDEDLKFKSRINKVSGIISRNLGIICRAKYLLNKKLLLLLYNALVLPYISYCLVEGGSNYETNLKPVITAQKRAIRLISGASRVSHTSPLFREMRLLRLVDLLNYQLLLVLHDCLFGRLSDVMSFSFALHDSIRPSRVTQHFSQLIIAGVEMWCQIIACITIVYFLHFCKVPKISNRTVASRIPNLDDIPPSKCFFKKCIKLLFLDEY